MSAATMSSPESSSSGPRLSKGTHVKRLLVVCLTLMLPATATCQQPKADLQSLRWLSGCWEGHLSNGLIITEQWMKPLGNLMLSTARTVRNGKTVEYEFVRLEQSDDGVIRYRAHPSGQEEAAFTLVKLEGHTAIFENLLHDYPQRIIYQLVSADSLLARIEGTIGGKERSSNFPYQRVKCEQD